MPKMTNDTQVEWAAKAVHAYDVASGGGLVEEGLAECLLASLIHLADKRRWDFLKMLGAAIAMHSAEVEEVKEEG